MRRVIVCEPAPDPGPQVPEPASPDDPEAPFVGEEPVPAFTRQIHTDYTWCGYAKGRYGVKERGHLYTFTPYAQRVARWVASEGRLPLSYVTAAPECPHCARDEWREREKERDDWVRAQALVRAEAVKRRARWEAHEAYRARVLASMADGTFQARNRRLDLS